MKLSIPHLLDKTKKEDQPCIYMCFVCSLPFFYQYFHCVLPLTGLSHDNTWIGLNDRTVEDDFQWTDKTDLVRPFTVFVF